MLIHQIEMQEFDGAPQFRTDADQFLALVARAQQIAFAHLIGHRFDHVLRKDGACRLLQHRGRDVGGQDGEFPSARDRGGEIGQHHRQRVGFGADRAGRAPDLIGTAGSGPVGGGFRQAAIGQIGEMAGFAVEIGLVGGDRVDQMHRFGVETALLEHHPAVIAEIGAAQGPRAPPEPPLDHGLLAGRHLDAGGALDEFGHASEIGTPEQVDIIALIGHRRPRFRRAARDN